MKPKYILAYCTALTSLFWGCNQTTETTTSDSPAASETVIVTQKKTGFSADNAYNHIKSQLDFGFRIPGTPAHKQCADWLLKQLKTQCDTTYFQVGQSKNPTSGATIPIYNIIGSINPQAEKRMIFAAHWDSRPMADQDDNNPKDPILAANDGASGVGVILELARILHSEKPEWGVDFILFDAEDLGVAEIENSFCLGSQYWGKNLHKANYKANFGVLLDMVGGKDAKFMWEANSNQYANWILVHTWQIAKELGHDNHFQLQNIGAITDDHKYVYEATNIPMIDIIQYNEKTGFAPYWHTHDDNLDAIDKNTLQAVGNTLLNLIFNPPATL
jgi:Zn-dependent M28 family amino/carboxypeptidase